MKPLKMVIGACLFLGMVAFLPGCLTPERQEELVDRLSEIAAEIRQDAAQPETPEAVEAPQGGEEAPSDPGEQPAAAPAVTWCWGGFNGSRAVEVSGARIKNLKVTGSGLSYQWEKGGCEELGATSKTDCDHTVACLFIEDGRGGKFDWISTSRLTRDLKNVETGYKGWDAAAFKASKRLNFCICSHDGKRRTNFIEAER